MTTSELEGRALAEAAARAMGWHKDEEFGNWIDTSGEVQGEPCFWWVEPMLAWLDELGFRWRFWCYGEDSPVHARADKNDIGRPDTETTGQTLLEALQRLVVAVAAREQAAKGEP